MAAETWRWERLGHGEGLAGVLGRKEEVAEVGEAAGNPALPWDHLKVLIRAACILDCHSPSASAPLLDQGRKLRASWEPAAFWSSQGAFPPPLKAGAKGPGLFCYMRGKRRALVDEGLLDQE